MNDYSEGRPAEAPDALSPSGLRRRCDPSSLSFETTEELKPLEEMPGQDRAREAIAFGTSIERAGFNMFVLGEPGTGRHTAVRDLLARRAAERPTPRDWVYLNNFEDPQKPKALALPAGQAITLKDHVSAVIEELAAALPSVFDSDEYRRRRRAIDEEFEEAQEKSFEELQEKARGRSIAVVRTPMGFALAPMRNGQVVKPEVFNTWSEEERHAAQEAISELQDELRTVLEQLPRLEKDRRAKLRELDREFAELAVNEALEDLRKEFAELPEVAKHLDAMRNDLIDNAGMFTQSSGEETKSKRGDEGPARRYMVNVMVASNHSREGAPLISEDNPTLPNLVGRTEHLQQMGTLVTDFMLIRPGALHRANGGYLLIDARKVLTAPLAWDALKRALRNRRIDIESLGEHLSLISTVSLEPEPIPFDAKVVLFGERIVYYLLCQLDPDFADIFKVAVDFDEVTAWDDDSAHSYARLVASVAKREELLPFDRSGVARMLEQAGRLAEDSERFSVQMRPIADLAREADYWARSAEASTIAAAHVIRAEQAQRRRLDRLREKSREVVARDIVLIDTDGVRVGQVNGLAVLSLGAHTFGRPSRITGRTRLGTGKVIDIERETELGGPLHSKGVLILSGFLTSRYALDWPVSLSASIVFEQSYGGVDGDSASAAELCALLSAIAQVPLRQDLAITGSVNQFGDIQAIGGVNEKIEGFFDVCNDRGLTGRQGVVIPSANAQHLMLREEVVEACEAGRFFVYPVEHIDQAMALFSGLRAGPRDESGAFPPDTVNARIENRPVELAQRRLALGAAMREGTENAANPGAERS